MSAAIARPKDAWQSPATAATHPAPVGTVRLTLRAAVRVPIVMAIVATVALAALSAIAPPSVFGGTTLDPKCDGVVLRAKPSSTLDSQGAASAATRAWSRSGPFAAAAGTPSAAGTATGAASWYKIVSVNGKSASSLYGRKHVYAARSLFSVVYLPLEAACDGVRLRTSPRTRRAGQAQARRGRQGHRVGHRVGRQLERRLRRLDRRGPAGTGSRRSAAAACPRSTASAALYAARGLLRRRRGASRSPPDTSGYIEGIDVSHWQGTIDWVEGRGGRQAVRVHEGVRGRQVRRPDLRHQPRPGRTLNGLKVGAYHFAKPGHRRRRRRDRGRPLRRTPPPGSGGDLLPGARPRGHRGPGRRPSSRPGCRTFLDRIYARTGVRADDLHLARVLEEQHGRHPAVRRRRLSHAVDRALDHGALADRAGRQLGRQRLDVLAVHLGRDGARHLRPRRPRPLPVRGLRAGHASSSAPPAARPVPSPRLLGHMEASGTTASSDRPRRADAPGPERAGRPRPGVGDRRRRGGRRAVRRSGASPTPTTRPRGGASRFIEDFIRDAVLPLYANTHTESSGTGLQTTRFREEARRLVLEGVGGDPERHAVVFCGSGLDRRDQPPRRRPQPPHPGRPRRSLGPPLAHPARPAAGRVRRARSSTTATSCRGASRSPTWSRSARTATATSTSTSWPRSSPATPTGR